MLEEMKRAVGGGGNRLACESLGVGLFERPRCKDEMHSLLQIVRRLGSEAAKRNLIRKFVKLFSLFNCKISSLQGRESNCSSVTSYSCERGVKNKAAFTLAEVLITLGIIGVVAAITMPVLISKYKNQVYVNQLKKSVSVFENGIKLIIANEGATDLSETEFGKYMEDDSLSSDELYNKLEPIFKKNFNVVKSYSATEMRKLLPKSGNITNTEDCKKYIGKVSSIAYKVNNTSQCSADPSGFVFYLADGSYVDFEKFIKRPVDNSSDAKVLFAEVALDTNGLKGPNQQGHDYFTFLLDSMGNLHPAGGIVWAKTAGGEANWKNYYWSSGVGYTCKVKGKNYSGYGTGCSASVIENGWKIDY